jgi:hypothetical protein
MAKLRIKDIEGDADEIKNLFKDLGCDLNSYINTTPVKNSIPNYWLVILVPVFFILTCLVWCDIFNPTWTKVSVLGLFLLLGLITLIVHHNHDRWPITIIQFFAGFSLILLSLNVYTPQELAKRIEDKTIKKIEGE